MRKYIRNLLLGMACAVVICFGTSMNVHADGNVDTSAMRESASEDTDRIVFEPTGDERLDARTIEAYLNNDEKKTLVIPKGTIVKVQQVLDIGSNTTIIAEGATIIQTTDGRGLIQHATKGFKYNAIENVTIIGGTWKSEVNTKAHSMMRFAHGKNITLENLTIETNYQSHGVAFVACKDVVVDNCDIIAKNDKTKKSDSVEEALQIDVATPLTAPGIYRETGDKAYVNGQICQNVVVKNSTIYGSRGVCTNFAGKEKQFHNKFHKNITITGCTITGTSSEGLALLNSIKCTVKNNTIKSLSNRENSYSDGIHLVLIGKTKEAQKHKSVITGNKVYGKYYGIDVTSSNGSLHGTVVVKNNMVYCKKGKKYSLHIVHCKKIESAKNTCKKW